MAVSEQDFKTTLMGGFDKEDVLSQVKKMQDETVAEKSKLLQLIQERDKKIADLEARVEQKEAQINKLETTIREKYQSYIDNYDTIGQLIYDTRVRSDQMMKEAEEKRDSIIREADAYAKKRRAEADAEAEKKLADGRKKYDAVQEELNHAVDILNQVQHRFMQTYKSVHQIIHAQPDSLCAEEDELMDEEEFSEELAAEESAAASAAGETAAEEPSEPETAAAEPEAVEDASEPSGETETQKSEEGTLEELEAQIHSLLEEE